ncbi:hypothetical protein KY284_030164 [Solanum tuberosum]|nr:hypothetical protein KY284_030164 [Solanum tuberosum]
MEIVNEGNKVSQVEQVKIHYDMVPLYCKHCKVQGHADEECRSLHTKLKTTSTIVGTQVQSGAKVAEHRDTIKVVDDQENENYLGKRKRYWNPTGKIINKEVAKDCNQANIQVTSDRNPFAILERVENETPIVEDVESGSLIVENETQRIAREVDARLPDHEYTEIVRHKQHELKTIREESQNNHQEVLLTKDWVLTSFNKQQDINVSNNNSIANQQEAYEGTDTCPENKDLGRGEETAVISSFEAVSSTDEVVNTTIVSSNQGEAENENMLSNICYVVPLQVLPLQLEGHRNIQIENGASQDIENIYRMKEEQKLINSNEQAIIHAGTQKSTLTEKLHGIVLIEDEYDDEEGGLLEVQVYQHADLSPKTKKGKD